MNITITRRITPAWHLAACWTAAVTISRELPGGERMAMLTWSRWNNTSEEEAAVQLELLTQMAEQHAEQAGYSIIGRLGVPPVLEEAPTIAECAARKSTRFLRAEAPTRPHLWAKVHGPKFTGYECWYCHTRAAKPAPGQCHKEG